MATRQALNNSTLQLNLCYSVHESPYCGASWHGAAVTAVPSTLYHTARTNLAGPELALSALVAT